MKQDHLVLWQRIRDFELDDPAAVFPFSKKLAKEANWRMSFTMLAITEYKKFLLLCCISPEGASPSEVVDQVWHMHLTYTRNYWEELCSKVLGRPLHHCPSPGGVPEHKRHQSWYEDTLQLYKEVFEMDPPLAIWPAPGERELSTIEADYKNSIHIPADVWLRGSGFILLFLLLTQIAFGVLNPYLLRGPAFLEYMIFLFLLGISLAILLLSHQGEGFQKLVHTIYPVTGKDYKMIEFLHSEERAFQTAIVDLVNHRLLEVKPTNQFINRVTKNGSMDDNNPLVPALARRKGDFIPDTDDELTYDDLKKLYHSNNPNRYEFMKLEWLTSQKFNWRWAPYLLVMLLLIIRLVQGAHHQHPVGLLLLGMLLFTVVYTTIVCFYKPAKMLKRVLDKKRKEDLAYTNHHTGEQVVTDFSIRGKDALAGMESYAVLAGIFALSSNSSNATRNTDGDAGGAGGGSGGCSGSSGCGGCGGCGS